MPTEPQIELLPMHKRRRMFWLLVLIFAIALPALIFYTSGNRLSFSDDQTNIISVGGIYLSSDFEDVDVYLNESLVDDRRIFRQAFYIQNITAGQHQIHVQAPGLQTWVKEIPVYPHIVTEVNAITIPVQPQVRLISEYLTATGTSVVFTATSSEPVLTFASSTNSWIQPTTTATSSYVRNTEYTFVSGLFATSTATTSESLIDIVTEQLFESATTSSSTSETEVATTTKEFRDVRLYESGGEVFARWIGSPENIPFYQCVTYENASTTAVQYGEHVSDAIEAGRASSTLVTLDDRRLCRPDIRIDRKWQQVTFFDFFPNRTDVILMHLEDGLYAVEVDDRAWQNTQVLYPGTDLKVVLDGGRIYVKDGDLLLEVFTELQ